MGLFKRWRDKKMLGQIMQDVEMQSAELKEAAEKKTDGYILDRCEQMMESAREIDDSQKEYHVLTSYLNDVETIENLPPDKGEEIRKAAENVSQLNEARDSFLHTSKKISDAQYQMIQLLEEEIPDAVKRMRENEQYQAKAKRDMQYLEGEKQELEIQKHQCRKGLKLLRQVSYLLLVAILTVAVFLLVISLGWGYTMRYAWICTIAVAVICAVAILLRLNTLKRTLRKSDININYAITLSNKVKIKYVNATNAVDYAHEKYHVRDARELAYQWDMYQEAVREQEKYRQTNEDLRYYYDRLVGLLKKCGLYDARVWIDQPKALVDPKEMVEIKHNLLVRRQKIRSKIAYNLEVVKKERQEIERMMRANPKDAVRVKEKLESIDRLAGFAD